jgi:hypothetical protein
MTERRRTSLWTTAAFSLAVFLGALALLAWQMHAGQDPALGAGKAEPAPARKVLVRRIVKRVIVTRVIPAQPRSVPGAAVAPATAPLATTPSAPAPAPAAAPAPPAPAPAPPVTRTS